MIRNNRFRQGERVNGISLAGKKVLGEYRGVRASFGAYVYGLEEGCTELKLHTCLVLTLKRAPIEKHESPKLKTGDLCSGITKKGLKIHGKFMNREGQYCWIKGWPEGTNRLDDTPQAFKVLTQTLSRV